MNKRRRELLAALQPATDFALEQPRHKNGNRGLKMTARPRADLAAELMIYGTIGGGGWFDDGVTAAGVADALKAAGPGPVNVRINSGGGDVFDGIAIHTLLARHPGLVTVDVDGLAASAASFIMLAGDRIRSARNAFIMIHDAMTFTYGNPATHRKAADLLEQVSDNIADMYAERAGEDAAFWRAAMVENGEDGTWYTGQDALGIGLVDELTQVRDDFDEDYAVADRLRVWTNMLPKNAREFISDHPVETDDDEDIEADTNTSHSDDSEPVTSDNDEAVRDMGWAMLAALTQ